MNKAKILGIAKMVSNLGLPMDRASMRILRRAIIVGFIAFIGESIVGYSEIINPLYLPLLSAFGSALDKTLHEWLEASETNNLQ